MSGHSDNEDMAHIVVICDLTIDTYYIEINLSIDELWHSSAEVIVKKVEKAGIEFGTPQYQRR